MKEVIVTTKVELKHAKEARAEVIIIQGQLAADVRRTKKVAIIAGGFSSVALAGLVAALAATPTTGGASLALYAAAAGTTATAFTGIEIATLFLAGSIGITLLVSIFKDYEEIEASVSKGIKLKKKSK